MQHAHIWRGCRLIQEGEDRHMKHAGKTHPFEGFLGKNDVNKHAPHILLHMRSAKYTLKYADSVYSTCTQGCTIGPPDKVYHHYCTLCPRDFSNVLSSPGTADTVTHTCAHTHPCVVDWLIDRHAVNRCIILWSIVANLVGLCAQWDITRSFITCGQGHPLSPQIETASRTTCNCVN